MGAGKSEKQRNFACDLKLSGKRIIWVKPIQEEKRDGTQLITHGRIKVADVFIISDYSEIWSQPHIRQEYERADIICISDAQFLERGVEYTRIMTNRDRKCVISTVLHQMFDGNSWNEPSLVTDADISIHVRGICQECKREPSTRVLSRGICSNLGVGGMDDYKPVCSGCFDKGYHEFTGKHLWEIDYKPNDTLYGKKFNKPKCV